MNSRAHQFICHSWDESGSALVFNVHSRSQQTWLSVWQTRPEYRGDETDLMGDVRSCALTLVQDCTKYTLFTRTDAKTTPPPSPHPTHPRTRTSHYCFALPGGCCQGSDWASWLVVSVHHRRNSPVGLAGSIEEAFQDVFPSPPVLTTGFLITLIIATHCSFNLISSAS